MKTHKLWLRLCAGAVLAVSSAGVSADSDTVGDSLTALVGLGAFGATYAYDDHDGRLMLMRSMGYGYLANGVLRIAFNNTDLGERPNGRPYGFPSGHTGFLASGASFLQDRYGWQLGVPAWLATGYVAFERVSITHHHRWRDVIAAVAISQGFSWYFVDPYPTQLSLAPVFDGDAAGVALSYRF